MVLNFQFLTQISNKYIEINFTGDINFLGEQVETFDLKIFTFGKSYYYISLVLLNTAVWC